jgi:hypothetical protein
VAVAVDAATVAILLRNLPPGVFHPVTQAPSGSAIRVAPSDGRIPLQLIGQRSCFVAGTPLLTPSGEKAIEQFRVGDQILSRSQDDPEGPIEVKVVEETFVRVAPVLHLRVNGQTIRTTGEHPFFVRGQGWLCAKELQVGDHLSSHKGEWASVEAVTDLNEVTSVYNLSVGDYHTYFVGSREWGFSVWAHNAEYEFVHRGAGRYGIRERGSNNWVMEGDRVRLYSRDSAQAEATRLTQSASQGTGEGSQAADLLDSIRRAQERVRSGEDGGRRIIDSIEGSEQTLRNQLRRPYDPTDWD